MKLSLRKLNKLKGVFKTIIESFLVVLEFTQIIITCHVSFFWKGSFSSSPTLTNVRVHDRFVVICSGNYFTCGKMKGHGLVKKTEMVNISGKYSPHGDTTEL